MGKDANVATAKKMGEAINSDKLEEFHGVFAPDVVDHDPAPGQEKGPDGFISFFTQFRKAFPDLTIAVDHMVADENNVAIAYTVTGTQEGPFQGIPASKKKIKIRGMQIARFDDHARIKERWGSSDELGILQQIGASKPSKSMDEPPVISARTA